MILKAEDHLEHYGILRKSGRYPWGSGSSESARSRSFLDIVDGHRKDGMTDTEIAKAYGMTRNELTATKTIALNQQTQEKINTAFKLKEKGLSNIAIGEKMGINESTVRSLTAPGRKDKVDVLQSTSSMLKRQVADKTYVDVGLNVESDLPISDGGNIGISRDKFNAAISMLKAEGYQVHTVQVTQVGTGKPTTFKVLAPPGTTQKDVWMHRNEIKQIQEFSEDGGRTYLGIQKPISISSNRIDVKYAEDGGGKADGVIWIRPGVKDVSIGEAHYAQVRIAVDGTHYLKGMAVYKDDLPKGVDLQFNTNKSNTGHKKDAMKEMEKTADGKIDEANPFGAIIRQRIEKGPDGKDRVTSAMNIVGAKEGAGEEGSWGTWSKALSSQVLSKQRPALAKQQLDVTFENHLKEFDDINSLTNPTVRKKLLEGFADKTDSSAVHLKAASLKGSAQHVILPLSSIKTTEVYAPQYRDGTRLALIRSPHSGSFEIPVLTVNNKNREGKALLGPQAPDALGIHHKVAQRLSGADFDGDFVLAVPNNRGTIKSTPALEDLKNFDPKSAFPKYDGMIPINAVKGRDQNEMGKITNLIADMSIKGASHEEVARAVRHSMVVIDADKHNLDYKGSAKANGILQLKEKYQGSTRSGASTLITKAGSDVRVPDRKPRPAAQGGPVDKVTGKKVYVETGRTYVDKEGRTVPRMIKSTKLYEADDAFTLLSKDGGTDMERLYADHSNKLKGLANTARKEAVTTKHTPYSPSAKTAYSNEVASLDSKLNVALKNSPRERQAQVVANGIVSQARQANPHMDDATVKKTKNQALAEARSRTGAAKTLIVPTQSEWNAIQAGAISTNKLTKILNNSDLDTIKKLATPRVPLKMTSTKKSRAQAMLKSGYTQAEVAQQLGVSLTTLKTSISE